MRKKKIIIIALVLLGIAAIITTVVIFWNSDSTKSVREEVDDKDMKPVIYIYPTENTHVTVKLSEPDKLTCSYPKYSNKWECDVDTDGKIICQGKELYSLYYEGNGAVSNINEQGFCIKGSDTAEFLDEKLELLGLNYREREEFIIYWLPKMENNKYNIIYFVPEEKQDNYMKLDIEPKPDKIIRVNMVWKAFDEYIDIVEQELQPNERFGYTVVEWGGSELNN